MYKNRMTQQRLDIINTYNALEADYNIGGVLRDRPSNMRRMMSSNVQIHRMLNYSDYQKIKFTYDDLTECQKKIYKKLEKHYGFICYYCDLTIGICDCCSCKTGCGYCINCFYNTCDCVC